jgi:glycine/D-amino acid oxidase-like deaminating enzyme
MNAELRPRRCVVIGAGVLGVCVAARLAEAGTPPVGKAFPGSSTLAYWN